MALGCPKRNKKFKGVGDKYTIAITMMTSDAFYRICSKNNLLVLKAYDGRTANKIKIE